MVLVQSVIRRLQILCIPPGRIHGKICGYKGSSLKIREEESLLPFPAWGTGNVSLSFLHTVPLLINFTVTFTKSKKKR
jgi:hypothetical protein